jgi:hypothetical protein
LSQESSLGHQVTSKRGRVGRTNSGSVQIKDILDRLVIPMRKDDTTKMANWMLTGFGVQRCNSIPDLR